MITTPHPSPGATTTATAATTAADHLPADQVAPQHGRQGSRARLATLAYLAHRPKGAGTAAIAEVLGLDEADARLVLAALRRDQRVAQERTADGRVNWFIPNTRAQLRRGSAGGA